MPQAEQTFITDSFHQSALAWDPPRVETLLSTPFADLIYQAQHVHREHFAANEVQLSTLLIECEI